MLKNIIITFVWVLVCLYLLVMITFSTPPVQRYLGNKAANLLSATLGTSVKVERMDFGLPSHLTLYGVLVKDQSNKDMLRVGRLSANMDLLPLLSNKISISSIQIFGAHAQLYQHTPDSQPNFQFVIDSLASKDTTNTTPLDLRINSCIIRHSSVKYDRHFKPETAEKLNTDHLHLQDISAHILLKTLTEDSINLNIKRLSLKEKSGLNINRLSMKLEGGRTVCTLTDFHLRLPGTDVKLGDITAHYRLRSNHFVMPSLVLNGSILPSTITLADLSSLLPSLQTFHSTLSLSSNFHALGEDIQVDNLNIESTTGDISLDADGWIKQFNHPQPLWNANINQLSLSDHAISFISENLKGERIDVPPVLERIGNIHLSGVVSGQGDNEWKTVSMLNTDAGSMMLDFTLDGHRHFKGHLDAKDIQMQRLLDDEQFGLLTANINLNGSLPSEGSPVINADGALQQFSYAGYTYQNIRLNGLYSASMIQGKLDIDDPNLQLAAEGAIERQKKTNSMKVNATLARFSPKNTHLSDQWSDNVFSGQFSADLHGTSIDDATGVIDLSRFSMSSPEEHYLLENLHLLSEPQEQGRHIHITSDFMDADIKGRFQIETLPQSFINMLADKLPTLHWLPTKRVETDNSMRFLATIHKSDWLEQLLHIPLRITQPVRLQGGINDEKKQIVIDGLLPQFFYKNSRYDRCRINIVSPLNTLAYDMSITKRMDDGKDMDIAVTGSAYNNQLSSTLTWDDHDVERMSGKITAQANFETTFDGQNSTHIQLAPSHMIIKNAQWDVAPCHITYSDKLLDINGFAVTHNQQHLRLNGRASPNSDDSLSVSLRDIDVDYVLDLVNFHSVSFGGYATGTGTLRGIFGSLEADAKLLVNHFTFEHGRMGTLDADVIWNQDDEQIDIHAIADDGDDAQTFVNGYVSPKREYIDLDIEAQGTRLDFARSFMDSFISYIDGHADGAVRLAGPLDAINLTGQLVVNGSAHVKTLGCTYEMRDDTLHLIRDDIQFYHFPVYDMHGNRGMLSGGIHHKDLTRLTFDIYVSADNLLAYDFSDFGDDTFYGTVFATGEVGIHGRESSVVIEADVTPQQGSQFVYNAASPDAITDQEFIQWGTATGEGQPVSNGSPLGKVEPSSDFRFDLHLRLKINCTPMATIRLLMDQQTGDYITLRGNGDLQATYFNKGGFTMNGTYRVSEGTYGLTIQDIIKKSFTFREGGTIVFGGDPYDATLNLQAAHTVNGVSLSDLNVGKSFANTVRVNCLMNITGQPRQPVIDFDLEMPTVNTDEQQMVRSVINGEEEMNQQVIYLLAVGRFYPQQNNNATDEETGQSKTSLAMQSLLSGTLSGQINNVLGQLIKNDNWNFGANISTGDEGWNNAEYEGIINGRLLNNRLLINGQFGYRDNATTANPSFIEDFDISYLLFPNGNLALKVYNQTNDRYFTRSSLNTQGIGLLMKKDFSSLRDLLGIKKKKQKAKKRVKRVKKQ